LAIAKVVAELGSNVALLDMNEPQEDPVKLAEEYGTKFEYFKYVFALEATNVTGC